MFSSLILGGEPAWYFPLKEVKAARPVAEVSEHRVQLWHQDSGLLKHAASLSCAAVSIPSDGDRQSDVHEVVAVGT